MVHLHPSAGMIRIRCCGSDRFGPSQPKGSPCYLLKRYHENIRNKTFVYQEFRVKAKKYIRKLTFYVNINEGDRFAKSASDDLATYACKQ
jgi:hypothetical protein